MAILFNGTYLAVFKCMMVSFVIKEYSAGISKEIYLDVAYQRLKFQSSLVLAVI